jgi:hypothetical protein
MDALRVTREQIPHKRKRGGGIGVAVPGQATAQPFGERTTRIRSVVVNSVGNGKRR